MKVVCPGWHVVMKLARVERQRTPGFTAFNPGCFLGT
jgi:hypothetical protein